MTDDLYQETILEEYAHPKNQGTLLHPDVSVSESNASCGDQLTVFLAFDPATQKVADVSWQGVGCAISMASASFLSEQIKGKTTVEILSIHKENLEEMLGLHQISVGREKCLLLALKAFQKAVELRQKNNN